MSIMIGLALVGAISLFLGRHLVVAGMEDREAGQADAGQRGTPCLAS